MHIRLNTKTYPLEAILNASYVFLDRAYILLGSEHANRTIDVSFSPKKTLSPRATKELVGDFQNELLHAALRFFISQKNKNIREYIVGRALFSTLAQNPKTTSPQTRSYKEDPLGIAVPWEAKYGKKKKRS